MVHVNALSNSFHVVKLLHVIFHVGILANELFVGLEVDYVYLHVP